MANMYERIKIDENDDFIDLITNQLSLNTEYLRYWHGSMIIIRPLLTFLNINQIYLLNKIVMWTLALALLIILFIKNKKLAIIYVIAMIMIAFPMVPFCLEYTWTFYLMLISSIIAICIEKKGDEALYKLFFITGMLTCFFDFLTTEIITILVPILFVLFIRKEQNRLKGPKETILFLVKSITLWGISYCLMWFAKWIIVSILLKTNAIKNYVLERALIRVYKLQGIESYKVLYSGVIFNNWHCLYPINIIKRDSTLLKIVIGFLLVCFVLIDWKNIKKKWFSGLMLTIAIVPYIRYLVLANHSFKHYFFTYRNQIITIIAIGLILVDCFNKKLWLKQIKKKNK